MAADDSLRIVVKINPSRHPELHKALQEIETGGRAERVRALALMALTGYVARDGDAVDKPSQAGAKPNTKQKQQAPVRAESVAEKVASAEHRDEYQEEGPDPHQELRASVVSGLKKMDF